ncbi:MAG: pyridoxamine 5'-phosphate oxidase [Nitriliruptorales bacterium]|nr:pyridoxamine 5'-phosphate oxidase [Nitriliruptorales bacterium]
MPDHPPLDVAALRREYANLGLDEQEAGREPFTLFRSWLQAALAVGIAEPNAMVLATVGHAGAPSVRTVLLKGFDDRGFVFFTNYTSRKARELADNPRAALVFPWIAVGRQVTVRGTASRLTGAESDEYFATRPRGSQVAAWASRQSDLLSGRAELDAAVAAVAERVGQDPVTRPAYWGGFRLSPEEVEFWQGRGDRLHDRLRFSRTSEGWRLERLWP